MIHIYSLAQLLKFTSLAVAHFIRIVFFSFLFFLGLYNKLSVLACLQLVNLKLNPWTCYLSRGCLTVALFALLHYWHGYGLLALKLLLLEVFVVTLQSVMLVRCLLQNLSIEIHHTEKRPVI